MTTETQTLGPFSIRVWSEGSGAPLLYLHGFEQHPGAAPFLTRLAQSRRVVAPEHPGYGKSTGFETIDELLDLLLYFRRFIDALALGPVDLLGHDLGGMIAAEVAAVFPQRVRRLVLVDGYGLWLDGTPLPDPFVLSPTALRAAKWHDPETAPNPEPSLDDPASLSQTDATLLRAQNLSAAAKFLWPIPDRGLRKRLPLITAPTLVVHGEADGLIPLAYADELARLIPGARLLTIPKAGHLPMLEQEEAFCAAVEAFLAE